PGHAAGIRVALPHPRPRGPRHDAPLQDGDLMPPETMHTQDPPAGTTPVDHCQRIPYQPAGDRRIEMHSGLSRHHPTLHANLVELPGSSRRRGVIMCHPASNFLSHFLLAALARADQPAMGLNTRYANNEPALLMERAAADLGTG